MKDNNVYMKKYLILAIVVIGFVMQSNAQNNTKKQLKSQIDSEKATFFTEQIGLTPNQAPKFWTLYNKFYAEEQVLRHNEEILIKEINDKALSDTQYEQILSKIKDNEAQQRKLQDQFHHALDNVLSKRQKILYYKATKEYRAVLLQKLKKYRNKK